MNTFFRFWKFSVCIGFFICNLVGITAQCDEITPIIDISELNNKIDGTICLNIPFTLKGSSHPNAVSYNWIASNINAGLPSITNTSSIDIKPKESGEYLYTYSVILDSNCTFDTSIVIIVLPEPEFSLDTNAPILCTTETENLALSAMSSDSDIINWNWEGPNGLTSPFQNVLIREISSTISGLYYQTATDSNGCMRVDSINIIITDQSQIGTPCDDDNPITQDDKIQEDCTCAGMQVNNNCQPICNDVINFSVRSDGLVKIDYDDILELWDCEPIPIVVTDPITGNTFGPDTTVFLDCFRETMEVIVGHGDQSCFSLIQIENRNTSPPLALTCCPMDTTVIASPNELGSIVNWTPLSAISNPNNVTITRSHQSGDFFPSGTTLVTATAVNDLGQNSGCEFRVTVLENSIDSVSCRVRDSLALVDLYNSTNGANWKNQWDLAQPMNTWFGVHLTQQGCVSALILHGNGDLTLEANEEGNNLSGIIPNSIGLLSEIRTLNLRGSNLFGEIPFELGNLQYLTGILLEDNQLSGELPSSLGNIPALGIEGVGYLGLTNNQLSGCFPQTFLSLCNIQVETKGNSELPWIGNFDNFCNCNQSETKDSLILYTDCLVLDKDEESCLDIKVRNYESVISVDIVLELDTTLVEILNIESNIVIDQTKKEDGILVIRQSYISQRPNIQNDSTLFTVCVKGKKTGQFNFKVVNKPELFLLTEVLNINNMVVPISQQFCNPIITNSMECMGKTQIGVPCNDKKPYTHTDKIQEDCTCEGIQPIDTVVFTTYPRDTIVQVGEEICFYVVAENFDSIFSVQYSHNFREDLLRFERSDNYNLMNLTNNNFGFRQDNAGVIMFTWSDIDVQGKSHPSNIPLYQICFTALKEGNATLSISGNPVPIEIVTISGQFLSLENQSSNITIRENCMDGTIVSCPTFIEINADGTITNDNTNFIEVVNVINCDDYNINFNDIPVIDACNGDTLSTLGANIPAGFLFSSGTIETDFQFSNNHGDSASCAFTISILDTQIGDNCDDSNPNTQDDKIQEDCSCAGTQINTSSSNNQFNINCIAPYWNIAIHSTLENNIIVASNKKAVKFDQSGAFVNMQDIENGRWIFTEDNYYASVQIADNGPINLLTFDNELNQIRSTQYAAGGNVFDIKTYNQNKFVILRYVSSSSQMLLERYNFDGTKDGELILSTSGTNPKSIEVAPNGEIYYYDSTNRRNFGIIDKNLNVIFETTFDTYLIQAIEITPVGRVFIAGITMPKINFISEISRTGQLLNENLLLGINLCENCRIKDLAFTNGKLALSLSIIETNKDYTIACLSQELELLNSNRFNEFPTSYISGTTSNLSPTSDGGFVFAHDIEIENGSQIAITLLDDNCEYDSMTTLVNCMDEQTCRQTDSLALIALYNATNGVNWTNQWDLNQPMNTWYGITLDNTGCVICIDMDGTPDCGVQNLEGADGNNLVGVLPEAIGDLRNLMTLNLSHNQLTGIIPSSIGNLESLKDLRLIKNELNGAIPESLGNLSNLIVLWLNQNQLTGDIPVPTLLLPNLRELVLHDNQLSGGIPSELGDNQNLSFIALNNNNFSGCYPETILNGILGSCDIEPFTGNSQLPYQGVFQDFCKDFSFGNVNQFISNQFGLPCNDGNSDTQNDLIQEDCSCQGGCSEPMNLGNITTVESQLTCDELTILDIDIPIGFRPTWTSEPNTINVGVLFDTSDLVADNLIVGENRITLNLDTVNCTTYNPATFDLIRLSPPNLQEDRIDVDNKQSQMTFSVVENDDLVSNVPFTIEVVSPISRGQLDNLRDGTFVYIPPINFTGVANFDYRICYDDCMTYCDRATVLLNVSKEGVNEDGFIVPEAFTPNDDGINDSFIIPILQDDPAKYSENELIVINRWGDQVYYAKPYDNDWKGTNQKGKPLPAATYYYILRLDVVEGDIIRGEVTLIR